MVDASLCTGMTTTLWPILASLHAIIATSWGLDEQGCVHPSTCQTVHQHDGRWPDNRLHDEADISAHGLAQVVQPRDDACAYRHCGSGHTKSPQTTVVAGEMGHRRQQ